MNNLLKTIRKTSERGQAIILIAFSIVGLVAIVGLMIDGGILLIQYARLKRGIDAASIAAASQFRKNFSGADLVKAGEEFLKFNQSNAQVTIFTCSCPPNEPNCVANGWHLDALLCPPHVGPVSRKLVRITASEHVDFGFIRILGINGTTVSATSVGEAASIDMVLVLDTSTSMAFETTFGGNPSRPDAAHVVTPTSPGDDPEVCNAHMHDAKSLHTRCEPMGDVKDAAVAFVDELFFPYDRVALVATTGQGQAGATRDPVLVLPFSDNDTNGVANTEVQDAIRQLRVFQPDRCPMPLGEHLDNTAPCLFFNESSLFQLQACMPYNLGVLDPTDTTPPYDTILKDAYGNPVKNPSTCGPSNIGGGLYEAGRQFVDARQDSFWVAIALFGGPANAFNPLGDPDRPCPTNTWKLPGNFDFCRDEDPMPPSYNAATYNPAPVELGGYDWSTWTTASRHNFTVDTSTDPDTIIYPSNYDADDYARDGADYITSPSKGQGATLFSICMGDYCRHLPNANDPASGERLGQYMALRAGDDLTKVPPERANHGLYFYAQDSTVVGSVFEKIAENIFTRISQ